MFKTIKHAVAEAVSPLRSQIVDLEKTVAELRQENVHTDTKFNECLLEKEILERGCQEMTDAQEELNKAYLGVSEDADRLREENDLLNEKEELQGSTQALTEALESLRGQVEALEAFHVQYGRQIEELSSVIAEKNREITGLEKDIRGLERENQELVQQLEEKEETIRSLQGEGEALESHIQALEESARQDAGRIEKLERFIQESQEEASSLKERLKQIAHIPPVEEASIGPFAAPSQRARQKKKLALRMVEFSFRDGKSQKIFLTGSFTNWTDSPIPLTRGEDGVWRCRVKLPTGEHTYKYIVDGAWKLDPDGVIQEENEHGTQNSKILVK